MAIFKQLFSLQASPMTFTSLNVPAGDQSIVTAPAGNPASTLSSVNIVASSASNTTREFAVNVGFECNTGGGDKVAFFSGMEAGAGTSDVWSVYSGLNLLPASGNYNSQGYELDLNNENVDRGTNGNLTADLGGFISYGLSLTGASQQTNTGALLISSSTNGTTGKPQWSRGIILAGTLKFCGYQDVTSAPVAVQFDGVYSVAAINLTSLYANAGAITPTALFMKNNQQIAWQNANATNAVSDKVDAGNNRYVGVGAAGVFTGAILAPIVAGLNLGTTTNPWGIVYSSGGVQSVSDIALKTEVTPLAGMSSIIQQVEPIAFRWEDPSVRDDKVHYGFDASTIRDAFPSDFAGHAEHDGVQHLCKEELISVLWQANREMLARIDHLEAQIPSK